MRGLKNLKTKEIITLEPGQDIEEIRTKLSDPDNWEYICEERGLTEMELQDSDTGLAERQKRTEIDDADEKRLTMHQRAVNPRPKISGIRRK